MGFKWIIAIPSYRRHKMLLYKENTLSYMNKELLERTFIFTRESDMIQYALVATEHAPVNLFPIKDGNYGIPETRDQILINAIKGKVEKLIMIDDDIRFAIRPGLGNTYRKQTKEEFEKMIYSLLHYCSDEYPIVGITARQFSNNKTNPYDENTRIIQVYCINMNTIMKEQVFFSTAGFPYMTDYYFVLKMLTLGYKNLCLNEYTRDDDMQAPGGCSESRTVKACNQSAIRLSSIFPKYVKPYWKENGTWDERRLNVRVSWKKAFNQKLYDERKK